MNLNQLLNPYHTEFFQSTNKEVIFFGGAAGGKSVSVADKLLLQPIIQKRELTSVVIRKSMPSLKRTCLAMMERRAQALKIDYKIQHTDNVMYLPYNSKVYFLSINHYSEIEKIKSLTDVDFAHIEEANELSEEAVTQTLLRLRGGKGLYKQLILSFNPVATTNWIYNKYFSNKSNAHKIKVTVDDNPFIEKEYIETLDSLKNQNENLYRVYRLGEFGTLEGTIYHNWQIVERLPEKIDEVIYGLDFGFNHKTGLCKIYFCDNAVCIEERIYQSGLTPNDLVDVMKGLNIGKDLIYCDSARPDIIEELNRAGFNALPSDKDVNAGISFCQSLQLNILDGGDYDSSNIIKELQSYSWQKNKDGNYIDKPVKFNDDLVDSFRYPLYTHLRHRFQFIKIGPDGMLQSNKVSSGSIGEMILNIQKRKRYGL